MKSSLRRSTLTGIAAVSCIVGLATSCSREHNAPANTTPSPPTTTTSSTELTPSPTEKDLTPNGGNKFTPSPIETPAPPTGGGKGGH
jgi:hypothetical protein